MKNFKFNRILVVLITAVFSFQAISCSEKKTKNREELIAQAMKEMDEALCIPIDVNTLKADEMLPGDIPIFSSSSLTYANRIEFQNSVNIFHRYNTSSEKMDEVIQYYKEEFTKYGWETNTQKTSDTRIFLNKDEVYVTVRIFEMLLVEDSLKTAFTINLVKPK